MGKAPEETAAPTAGAVYEVAEQMPEYPGGYSALMRFIAQNLKYPVAAQQAKIQGRVIVQFVIDTEGNVTAPKILQGVDPLLDAEAIRLTTIMPKWRPGREKGEVVNVKYTVPLTFKLQ